MKLVVEALLIYPPKEEKDISICTFDFPRHLGPAWLDLLATPV